jgi:hypothetical protein
MHWAVILVVIFGSLLLLMATGIPVAFCFLAIILVAGMLLWGGGPDCYRLLRGWWTRLTSFPLFHSHYLS